MLSSLIVDTDMCEGEAALVEFMVFIWLIVALLTAYIAWAKRRAWYLWLIAGLILGILALLAVIGMPTKVPSRRQLLRSGKMRECPSCRELIQPQASKCPNCQAEVVPLPLRTWWGRALPAPQP